MAGMRGRISKTGGMAVDAGGASGRTEASATGQDVIVRPAFKIAAQIQKPTVPATLTGFFDPNSITFWRIAIGVAALGYILGWHLKVGRVRVPI